MKNKRESGKGFTLVELVLSMALLSILIAVSVQASDTFSYRLALLESRALRHVALMRLSLYLDDLHETADIPSRCQIGAATISCSFFSGPGGTERLVEIFSFAEQGFSSASWGEEAIGGVTRHFLLLDDGKGNRIRVHYGIFPGVFHVYE